MNKSIYITILTASLGFFLSGFIGWQSYNNEMKTIIKEFENDVNERVASMEKEIDKHFEILYSLKSHCEGSGIPSSKNFHRVTKDFLSRHNDIQALEWIPRIPRAKRSFYELKRQREFPDFEITERVKQGHMISAKQRDEYFPVYYVEPLQGNEPAFGFDLASDPARLETLQRSRDSGKLLATASITLVQEKEKQKGFLAFLPIYQGIPVTTAKRRKNLIGFITGVFRIGEIFESSALSEHIMGINMTLIDDSAPKNNNILHSHKSRSNKPVNKNISYRKSLHPIGGRNWSILAHPTAGYISERQSILPVVVFISGIIFVLFVVGYIQIITKRTRIVESLVREQTHDLNVANEKLKLISTTDGLTGIANRRYLDDFLDKEWLRAIRNGSSITLILIDIDYFKLYNDNYGHAQGDECLKHVAKALKNIVLRPGDIVARYGGEEFVLVLPDTNEEAKKLANNCRKTIEDLQIPHEFSKASRVVTISVGMSTVIPSKDSHPVELIESADKALYKAKGAGRNRVEQI